MAAVSTLLPALLALSVIVLGGRLVLRPLFHHVAAAGSTEFFIAACLFVVIGTGVLTAMSGLSMGLGAFIAGLLLAETEYRREIEVTIEPFKGLLLGLFFVSVGASLDLRQVIAAPERTLGFAAAFMLIKFIVIWLIGRLMRLSSVVAAETALLLAPGGEFAFVMITAAVTLGSIPAAAGAHVMIAVTLSMFTVPLLAALAKALPRPKLVADPELEAVPALDAASHPVIIAGYGRVGQLIGDMLRQKDIPFLAVDGSVKIVKTFRRAGVPIYWGNAERPDFLVRCGLAQARALVVTLDASQASEAIVRFARAAHPDLTIVARARDAAHATHLYELGVSDAVPETVEASLQLAEAVLVDLGIPMGHVIAAVHEKRDEFRKILQPAAGRAAERRGVKLSARVRDIHRRQRLAADE
jgi:CPA2 family monovalent cation:H+ antiporter-2